MAAINEIKGHPTIEGIREGRPSIQITLCAECNGMRTVLFLSRDRWFCTKCRNTGEARPKQISMFNPQRKS